MKLVTEDLLREATSSRRSLDENIREFSVYGSNASMKFDIFLSHSYLDKDVINGLYNILTGLHFKVYVDWIIDPQLDRSNVTETTARLIRSRMYMSRSLLYCISAGAIMSKWMPWELGYVDGNTNHKCAVMPVAKDYSEVFNRSEYLKLYPFITKEDYGGGLVVRNDEYSVIDNLNDWVRDD